MGNGGKLQAERKYLVFFFFKQAIEITLTEMLEPKILPRSYKCKSHKNIET